MKKLSEYTADEGIDIIADIVMPIADISMDPDALKLFKPERPKPGENTVMLAMKRLKAGIPALIKGHRDSMIEILAAFERCTPSEYRQRKSFLGICKDLYTLLNDDDLAQLFGSAQTPEAEASSGSAQENTGDAPLQVLSPM